VAEHARANGAGARQNAAARMRPFLFGRPLDACVDAGRDNILLLRLLAALLVVLGHSYVLVGDLQAAGDPVHRLLPRTHAHLVGVALFFTISGFLITLSYQRRPDLLRFLRARCLRLWPALALVVVASACVLGPMQSTLPPRTYFASADGGGTAFRYIWSNLALLDLRQTLPGVFASNPIPRIVNGSLWTIPYEAAMYLCVAAAGVLGLLRFPRLTSALIVVAIVVVVVWPSYGGGPYPDGVALLGLQLGACFGTGAIACLLRRRVPISSGIMLALAAISLLARETPLMWLAVVYFVFWFAYVPRLPSVPRDLDLSYGTYLWAFPVQQTIVALGDAATPLALFATATPIVLAIAAGSWLLVERPSLRLKDPRRRRLLDGRAREDVAIR
jgi:peptidoglycan/LPS O-acetylase OafA/YrhL